VFSSPGSREGRARGPVDDCPLLCGDASVVLQGVVWQTLGLGRVKEVPGATRTAKANRYSFPSGHTLHAIAWMVMPFTFLVALSRVVLGLHYPSDVLAGALIGFSLAWLSVFILAAL